jgi:hypothetical protein
MPVKSVSHGIEVTAAITVVSEFWAACAGEVPRSVVPVTAIEPKFVIEVPGYNPTLPLIVVAPVLVIVDEANTAYADALPKFTHVSFTTM